MERIVQSINQRKVKSFVYSLVKAIAHTLFDTSMTWQVVSSPVTVTDKVSEWNGDTFMNKRHRKKGNAPFFVRSWVITDRINFNRFR